MTLPNLFNTVQYINQCRELIHMTRGRTGERAKQSAGETSRGRTGIGGETSMSKGWTCADKQVSGTSYPTAKGPSGNYVPLKWRFHHSDCHNYNQRKHLNYLHNIWNRLRGNDDCRQNSVHPVVVAPVDLFNSSVSLSGGMISLECDYCIQAHIKHVFKHVYFKYLL